MADTPRELLAGALQSVLSPEQLAKLIDEVLAVQKRMDCDFSCKHCGRSQRQIGYVNDAKAVALALPDLLNQAFGRVGESTASADPVLFKRLTITDSDEDVESALRAVEEDRRRQRDERPEDGAVHPESNGHGQKQAASDPDLQEFAAGNDEAVDA